MKTTSLLKLSLGITTGVASFYLGRSLPAAGTQAQPNSHLIATSSQNSLRSAPTDRNLRDQMISSSPRSNPYSSPQESASRFEKILATSAPLSRMELILDYTQSLAASEFPEALENFHKAGMLNKNSTEYKLLLTAWAQVDPHGALAGISGYPDEKNASLAIITTWAGQNPEAAEQWALENFDDTADPSKGNPHLIGVISGLVEQDLESATRLLSQMPPSGAQKDAIKSVLSKLHLSNPEDAKTWTLSLAPGEAQDKAIQELAEKIASENPTEAIEWATSSGQETLLVATEGILDSWVKNDPEAALAWAESQPKDILAVAGPHLIKEMAAREDYAGASEWLASHDGNPKFDESIEKLVKQARKDAPELAADWAARITDAESREKVLTKLVDKWIKDDPARAQEYLNQENVPDSVRLHLTSRTATKGTSN